MANYYTEFSVMLPLPAHINPHQNPYLPLNLTADIPTLPDWMDSMDDFDIPDYL